MKLPARSEKALRISSWVLQIVLSISLVWAGYMKLFQPISSLALMWPWTGEVNATFVRFIGLVDLAGGLGLVLPALLRIRLILVPVAALAIVVLMICAAVFHISRGEASQIGVNIVFALLASILAWIRFTLLRKAVREAT